MFLVRIVLIASTGASLVGLPEARELAAPIAGMFPDADEELSNQIRRVLQRSKSLSVTARNINVQAQEGVVTLRGRVASELEKEEVDNIVLAVGDVISVINELQITAK